MPAPALAPTDFFRRQDQARRRTKWLVVWFAAGVMGTVFAVYAAASLLLGVTKGRTPHGEPALVWDLQLFSICAGITLLIIGGASLMKSMALAGGGGKIAESVGGRKIEPDTTDTDERRLMNIVEEMSLASGTPMPEVYLLDHEDAINAFAAGDSIENAAVAVTRGALHKLSRDELQAVMGHEFSHILNGDMRLNLRLIGWIAGLVALTVVARVVMDTGHVGAAFSSRRDDRKNNAGLMLFGLVVLIIGLIGQCFAQLIQAAISRQREHLADASATQFTRNPEALANALRRIGGDQAGSRLHAAHATEIAHMCFGQCVSSVFATHPPLAERIRLLDPQWDGTFLPAVAGGSARFPAPASAEEVDRRFRARAMHASHATGRSAAFAGGETTPPPLLGPRLTPALSSLLHTAAGAQTAVILLLMTDNPAENRKQAELVRSVSSRELFETLKASWGLVHDVPHRDRLTVVHQAAPGLRRLTAREADALVALLRKLAHADGEVSFFEIALIRTVVAITHPRDDRADESRPAVAAPALRLILGALLVAGVEPHEHRDAFSRAWSLAPGFGSPGNTPTGAELTADQLEEAFATLARTDFTLRGQALAAADLIVRHDGVINDAEADLLRALASALHCPANLA